MAIYLDNIDITEGIIVTSVLLVILAMFYLLERKNNTLMMFIMSRHKPRRAELKKDTSKQDWLVLIIMLILVTMFGVKLVTLTVVVSDSMKPGFERGDIILAQSIDKTPQIGDIITFHIPDELPTVSHRVVSISNNGIIATKGDNNGYIDQYQTKQTDIVGKAIMYDNNPIVLKRFGTLFITDYKGEGVIFKWGDRFTFMQQLSVAIKTWGFVITIIAIMAYLVMMFGGRRTWY